MLQKLVILKAIDFAFELLSEFVKQTDNKLDDKVLGALKAVKEEVNKS